MLRIILIIALGATTLSAESLKMFEADGKYGYKDAKGKVVIPARFDMAQEFNSSGFASVIDGNAAYLIDLKGQKKLQVFIYDNGPDYFEEGLARFIENGKMGYFDQRGKKVIPAKYDFVAPFSNGKADVCNGCRPRKMGEHSIMEGGQWFIINKAGVVLSEKKTDAICDYAKLKDKCTGKKIEVKATLSKRPMQHPIISQDKESYWTINDSDWIFVSKQAIDCREKITVKGTLKTRVGPCKENDPTKNMYCGTALYVDSWKCQ